MAAIHCMLLLQVGTCCGVLQQDWDMQSRWECLAPTEAYTPGTVKPQYERQQHVSPSAQPLANL